jgi:hypothetical protein
LFNRMAKAGMKFRSGEPMVVYNGRGFGRFISSYWHEEQRIKADDAATAIAEAYVDATGDHPWRHY